ncbi:MAG: hypothetical protein ABIC82_04950 [bacterium]
MEEENNFQSISNKTPLNIGQKVMAVVLVFSAVIVLFFGLWQFKRNINSPFESEAGSKTQTSSNNVSQEDSSIIEMQNKDTDQDGLSDYEEFYIYKTSPYLADSDSDNIEDKKEIELGSNPNCGEGQNCGIVVPQVQQQNLEDASILPASNNATDIFDFSSLNNSSDLNNIFSSDLLDSQDSAFDLLGNLSVSEIRELLKESGLPSEVLDQLTDEQLLEAYKTTLENMNNEVQSP